MIAAEDADKKLERAIRKGEVHRYYNNDWIAEAERKGVITGEEARRSAEVRDLTARVIAVDHFDAAEARAQAAGASTQRSVPSSNQKILLPPNKDDHADAASNTV